MERQMGCLLSPNDLRDYRFKPVQAVKLPETFEIPASKIKDQGWVGSCVAHALSSMLEKYEETFSTGWIYGYRPEGYWQGTGMYPREALKTLQKLGAVKQQDFPYNVEMEKAKKIVDNELDRLTELAKQFKIKSYVRLFTENEIKQFLLNTNCPIPISIFTKNMELEDGILQIPDSYANLGGHMILIIGWNETGFIIQNSWGEEWGDKGLGILPYEYKINEAWGVILNESPSNPAKKPMFYLLRTLIQKLITALIQILRR